MRVSFDEGSFEYESMPSQPSLAICYNFHIYPNFRGRGFGIVLKRKQMAALKQAGYTAAMCTVQKSNLAQIKILERCGWVKAIRFHDLRNDSWAAIYTINLQVQ